MDDYKMSALNEGQMSQESFASSIVDPSFKISKDYSEQTRGQDDVNTAMRLGILISAPMVAGVPEEIIALSEAERSGMSHLHY